MNFETIVIEQRAHEIQRGMILEAQRNSVWHKIRNALREQEKSDTK